MPNPTRISLPRVNYNFEAKACVPVLISRCEVCFACVSKFGDLLNSIPDHVVKFQFGFGSLIPLVDRLSIRYEHGMARIIKSFSFYEQSVIAVFVKQHMLKASIVTSITFLPFLSFVIVAIWSEEEILSLLLMYQLNLESDT